MISGRKLLKNSIISFYALSLAVTSLGPLHTYASKPVEESSFSLPGFSLQELLCKNFDDSKISELERQASSLLKELYLMKIRKHISSLDFNEEEINKLSKDILECTSFYNRNLKLRSSHFGYPANMPVKSPLVEFFKFIEKDAFLSNNCGDVNESGNYQMDSKKIERDILELFAEKFGLKKYWGYIASGGSESNEWAIRTSFKKNPQGILYFCESAHYSIHKNAELFRYETIPQTSDIDESINCDILLKKIEENYRKTGAPANIILTWGTTKFGSCDDIKRITDFLIEKKIPYYVHVDAALFGGIPNNQEDAPIISNVDDLHIDSISVSLHKYIGVPTVKSVLLSTIPPLGTHVDYIGQTDNTTSGSRDILPFSTRQQVIDMLKHSHPKDYVKNIILFEGLLKERGIPFIRDKMSNIFVIDAPKEEICKKYQLSCFKDKNGKEKAHIIIFSYQDPKAIETLANDLSAKKV